MDLSREKEVLISIYLIKENFKWRKGNIDITLLKEKEIMVFIFFQ